jgi:parallel beta-helix repeat protein
LGDVADFWVLDGGGAIEDGVAGDEIAGGAGSHQIWSPCTAVATCTALATNILVYQSDGITLTNNVVSVSQVGIFIAANNATLTGNRSSANSVFDGIHFEGDSNSVKSSRVVNSSESGIYVDGNSNTIETNTMLSPDLVHGDEERAEVQQRRESL